MPDPTAPLFETLRVDLEGQLGHLTLDQPDHLNPIGSLALQELAAAAAWFDTTAAVVVVVRGAGRAFSAGFDLRELHEPTAGSARSPELGAAMAEAVASMHAVTIAAVQGPCVGGGFVLAMCCDLRIVAEDAWFSLPEAELGIPLAWSGVPRLVREVGPARATELIPSCRRVPATEAAQWGIVNRLVPAGELAAATDELAAVILQRSPTVVAVTKQQVQAAAAELVPTEGPWAGTEHLVAALRALQPGAGSS